MRARSRARSGVPVTLSSRSAPRSASSSGFDHHRDERLPRAARRALPRRLARGRAPALGSCSRTAAPRRRRAPRASRCASCCRGPPAACSARRARRRAPAASSARSRSTWAAPRPTARSSPGALPRRRAREIARLPAAAARCSTCTPWARAAARSRAWTRAGCCASGPRARAPTRARRATAAAGPRPSPTRMVVLGRIVPEALPRRRAWRSTAPRGARVAAAGARAGRATRSAAAEGVVARRRRAHGARRCARSRSSAATTRAAPRWSRSAARAAARLRAGRARSARARCCCRPHAGVLSAWGLLGAAMPADGVAATLLLRVARDDAVAARAPRAALRSWRAAARRRGAAGGGTLSRRRCALRYQGQSYELPLPVGAP